MENFITLLSPENILNTTITLIGIITIIINVWATRVLKKNARNSIKSSSLLQNKQNDVNKVRENATIILSIFDQVYMQIYKLDHMTNYLKLPGDNKKYDIEEENLIKLIFKINSSTMEILPFFYRNTRFEKELSLAAIEIQNESLMIINNFIDSDMKKIKDLDIHKYKKKLLICLKNYLREFDEEIIKLSN